MRGANFHPALKDMLVDAGRVGPHPENANNGDIDAIMMSMRTNGVYRPVYAQVGTGYILAGNSTYAALMELGASEVPVVWLDVDDATARRILAADNRTAQLGRMDNGLLLNLLREIEEESGLVGTGYEPEDIIGLLEQIEEDGQRTLHVEFDAHPPGQQAETRVQCPSCGYEWRLGYGE